MEIKLKNGDVLVLSKATEDDAKALIDYVNKVAGQSDYLTFGEGEFGITEEKEKNMIKESNKSSNKLFVVGKVKGEIIANLSFAAGYRERIKHTGEFGISVDKKYWGMQVGKYLIVYMIQWAKQNDIRKINLRVREDNKRAIKLYEKIGFVKEGVITRDFYMEGSFYSSIAMGIAID
ncbi:GNAT family N-acetyltransferase [Clostridiaceae bacterium M8S5]|nr:GNAT family N-acetyltransferase [Clostridiaceae bacterium M8S5]